MKFAKKRIIWPLAVLSVALIALWPAHTEYRSRRSVEDGTIANATAANSTNSVITGSNTPTNSTVSEV